MAKNKRRRWILIILGVLLLFLVAFSFFKSKNKPKGIEVLLEEVNKRDILETVSASGKIFPETEIKISSDVSGEIIELYVEEGDSIVTGQLLARIDQDAFASAVERGAASVNNAKAQKAMSQSQVSSAKAQKEQIAAQIQNAKNIHNRNIKLLEDGVISRAEFEQSESTLLGLEANLRASQASLESAEQSVEAARYGIKSAEASLKELKTSLSRTTIKAPATGIVSALLVEKGERVVGTIQMAGTEMMRIANLNAMEVQVDVSENDILRVSVGDQVDIEVDAYINKIFKGVVTEIANSASNISSTLALNTDQVTNFVVKVRVDPSSYQSMVSVTNPYPFRPGMSATVDIYTAKKENVLAIPIQAVTTREKEDSIKTNKDDDLLEVVFVMEGDTARMIEVSTGIQDDEYILVKSGLEVDQTIITGPYSAVSRQLKTGKEVRKKEEKEEDQDD